MNEKNPQADSKKARLSNRSRLISVAVFIAVVFCLLIVRFYQIQIVQGAHWKKVALSQHQKMETIPFMRGSFYSNTSIKKGHPEDKQPFVMDVQKFHLYIDPDSIPSLCKAKMISALHSFLETDVAYLEKEITLKSRSRKIAVWLDTLKMKEIERWWKEFCQKEKIARNALYFVSDYQRTYPFGSMLGTILHTVREEKDAEGQALPTGGLEMLYHDVLKGKKGKKLFLRSPHHPIDEGKIVEPPVNGGDIYLTINHYLQAIVESELATGVKKAGAIGGWAVMMDPYTGEILALAQTPTFNPANYREYYNDPALLETTKVKAVTDCFEPGSIFKPITIAVCLKASEEQVNLGKPPLLLPEEWIPCANGWFPGRSTPLKDGQVVHQYLNLDGAIQKSSNIYMGRVIQRVIDAKGEMWYRDVLTDGFGFHRKTGIELPAESVGLVPTPHKLHPNGKLEWSVPTPYSLAIGHNVLVNSIQLMRAYAILANGGVEVTPHIIRKIVKQGNVLLDNTVPKQGRRILSPAIAHRVVKAMKFATKEGGTARRADVMGYTEVGKTGTAEKVIDGKYAKQQNISSFIGFTPATQPRFILLVSIDEPEVKKVAGSNNQMGGFCAAPIFAQIASLSLQYLGVAPDDPYGYGPGDPRRDPEKADMAYELQQQKKAYEAHNR